MDIIKKIKLYEANADLDIVKKDKSAFDVWRLACDIISISECWDTEKALSYYPNYNVVFLHLPQKNNKGD